jgi:hypothetical protein
MINKSFSVQKNNNTISIDKNNSLFEENSINKSFLNENDKKESFINNYLPKLSRKTFNNTKEPLFTSPNIPKTSKKNLFSSYLSLTNKTENNTKVKFADSVLKNKNFFRANLKKKTTRKMYSSDNKHFHILDDIKILNNYNKKELMQNSIDYDYSLIIKKLDNWDKDHCVKNKMDLFSLHETLDNYYKKKKLFEEKSNLDAIDNMLREKVNYYRYKENKTYGIFGTKSKKNNIKIKKEESGEITENNKRNIFNSFIINNLNKDYSKNKIDFYNKMMKERLNYEQQLHNELIFVNNILYNKKYIKKDKIKEMDSFFEKLDKLKSEYEKKKENYMKQYYFKYAMVSQEHDMIISEKMNEVKNFKTPDRKFERKKTRKEINSEIKDLDFKRRNAISTINNEMKEGMDKIKNEYKLKFESLYIEKNELEKEIDIITAELNYYKIINEELLREHELYYLDILKKGKDCRRDGLVWVVKNLFELKINLEYHQFPKYLTHEQIDFLKDLAFLILEEDELRIILKILKRKQRENRENAKIEYMNFFDTITREAINKSKNKRNVIKKEMRTYEENTQIIKDKIDKKFLKVYKNNEEALKIYLTKSLEDEKFQKMIYYIKKALYSNNNFVKENKISIIEAFMGKTKNKELFGLILNITKRLHEIEQSKKALINKEKEYFIERIKNNNGNNAQTLDYIRNKELIKNCLFGSKIDF